MNRRNFLRLAAATAATGIHVAGCAPGETARTGAKGNVIVVGGGFAGATAAKYLRLWGGGISVTLVERNARFVSCPLSNLVIGGSRTLEQQTFRYDRLHRKYGIQVLRDEVIGIDPGARQVRLARGGALGYDRLVLAPGIDLMYERIPGTNSPETEERVPHAWQAGPQTMNLRKQLEAMRDGGVYVLGVPTMPYRCPSAPYERACQVARYFKRSKPRSKIIILDANPDIAAESALFTYAWRELYSGMVEYRHDHAVTGVDIARRIVRTGFGDVKGDVLNIIPPNKAGRVARMAGVANVDNRWCAVDFRSYESKARANIHVIGDAVWSQLPKSAHIANNQAHVCAAAIVALLANAPVIGEPRFANACYSFIDDKHAASDSAVYAYDTATQTMRPVEGTTGVSARASVIEGRYAIAWANNIWDDMLG